MSTVYTVITGDKLETAESYTKKERATTVAERRHASDPYSKVVVRTKSGQVVVELEAQPRPVKETKPRKRRPASDAPAIVEGWEVVYTRDNGDAQILRRIGNAPTGEVWSWNRKKNVAEQITGYSAYAVACVIHENLILTNSLYAERVIRPATHCAECIADRKRAKESAKTPPAKATPPAAKKTATAPKNTPAKKTTAKKGAAKAKKTATAKSSK